MACLIAQRERVPAGLVLDRADLEHIILVEAGHHYLVTFSEREGCVLSVPLRSQSHNHWPSIALDGDVHANLCDDPSRWNPARLRMIGFGGRYALRTLALPTLTDAIAALACSTLTRTLAPPTGTGPRSSPTYFLSRALGCLLTRTAAPRRRAGRAPPG